MTNRERDKVNKAAKREAELKAKVAKLQEIVHEMRVMVEKARRGDQ